MSQNIEDYSGNFRIIQTFILVPENSDKGGIFIADKFALVAKDFLICDLLESNRYFDCLSYTMYYWSVLQGDFISVARR